MDKVTLKSPMLKIKQRSNPVFSIIEMKNFGSESLAKLKILHSKSIVKEKSAFKRK